MGRTGSKQDPSSPLRRKFCLECQKFYDDVYVMSGVVKYCESGGCHRWTIIPLTVDKGKQKWAWNK